MSLLTELENDVAAFEAKCAAFVARIKAAAQAVRDELAAAEKAAAQAIPAFLLQAQQANMPDPVNGPATGVSDPTAPADASATSVPPADPPQAAGQ